MPNSGYRDKSALSKAVNSQFRRIGRLSDYRRENGSLKLVVYCVKEVLRRILSDRSLCRLHMFIARPGLLELKRQREDKHQRAPLISLIFMPGLASLENLHCSMRSVLRQSYQGWELCVTGSAVTMEQRDLLAEYSMSDPRIRSIGAEPSGEYVGFLEGADELLPDALYEVTAMLNRFPMAGFVYSDYAIMDERGVVERIDFCPEFSRYFFLSHPYIAHFSVIRRTLIAQVGGIDRWILSGVPAHLSGLFHLVLGRLADDEVAHVARVLYLSRRHEAQVDLKPQIAESMSLCGISASVEDANTPNCYRLRPVQKGDNHLVSVIIPTKNKWELLKKCIEGIKSLGGYDRYEIVVISNNTDDPSAVRYIDTLRAVHKVLDYPGEFNYSAIINSGVRAAQGDVLCFLNDDVEFIAPGTLEAAVEALLLDGVGISGGKLLYPDRRIQHAGVILGLGGIGEHWHKGVAAFETDGREGQGYLASLTSMREYSAVTGAFKLTWRRLFDALGGYDEGLRVGYNDIDFCLRAGAVGYKVMFTPYALAYHHESASRREDEDNDDPIVMVHMADNKRFVSRWKSLLSGGDRFYSPNLDLKGFRPRPRL